MEASEGGIPKADKEHKPVCCACKRSVPVKGGNTSNLMSHLKEHHAELFFEALSTQKTQQSKGNMPRKSSNNSGKDLANSPNNNSANIKNVLLASRKYRPRSPQALELNRSVAYFIARDCHPLSILERPGFRHLLTKLNPKYLENTSQNMRF